MAHVKPMSEWTVQEVVTGCPRAAAAFIRLRMACVGCAMAPFETLTEAAAAYGIEVQVLLEQLHDSSHGQQKRRVQSHDDGL